MRNLDNLIKQYRRSKKQQTDLNKKILNLQYKINDLKKISIDADLEAQELKTIIDFCIETGAEPSQAKLTYSITEMKEKIQPLPQPIYQPGYLSPGVFTNGVINNTLFNYPAVIKGTTK